MRVGKQRGRPKPPPAAKREPNELELLVARGVARAFDLADSTLEVFERDPERAVNAVIGAVEGIGMIGNFVRKNPEEAKRLAAGLAVVGVNKVSNAVISAGARQMRKDLNGRRK